MPESDGEARIILASDSVVTNWDGIAGQLCGMSSDLCDGRALAWRSDILATGQVVARLQPDGSFMLLSLEGPTDAVKLCPGTAPLELLDVTSQCVVAASKPVTVYPPIKHELCWGRLTLHFPPGISPTLVHSQLELSPTAGIWMGSPEDASTTWQLTKDMVSVRWPGSEGLRCRGIRDWTMRELACAVNQEAERLAPSSPHKWFRVTAAAQTMKWRDVRKDLAEMGLAHCTLPANTTRSLVGGRLLRPIAVLDVTRQETEDGTVCTFHLDEGPFEELVPRSAQWWELGPAWFHCALTAQVEGAGIRFLARTISLSQSECH